MPTKKEIALQAAETDYIVSEVLELDDSIYQTTLPAKYKTRKPYVPENPNNVIAFMPGTVRKYFVEEGERVRKGEKIMVLDAMKMNNELLSPIDGTVKKISVKTGESVPKHTVLAEIVPLKKGEKLPDKKKKK